MIEPPIGAAFRRARAVKRCLSVPRARVQPSAMQIYLIRHAHALDGENDALRPLSTKGRRQIRTVAAWLRRGALLRTKEFWHSPLVRARDTARLLAEGLRMRAKLVETGGLEPEANPERAANRLVRLRRPVAVVGHEPHLSALATRLLGERRGDPVVVMKKCAVLALERRGGRWTVRGLLSPAEIKRG